MYKPGMKLWQFVVAYFAAVVIFLTLVLLILPPLVKLYMWYVYLWR